MVKGVVVDEVNNECPDNTLSSNSSSRNKDKSKVIDPLSTVLLSLVHLDSRSSSSSNRKVGVRVRSRVNYLDRLLVD